MGHSTEKRFRTTVAGLALLALLAGMLAGCATRRGMVMVASCGPCGCADAGSVACADPCGQPCPPSATCPPGAAKPGEAWCQYWVPPEYRVIEETICVRPARQRTIQIPAEYGYRPKLVCDAPPSLREEITPPVWSSRTRDVLVCPETESWRRICCRPSDVAPGEIQCECWTKDVQPPVWREEVCPVCVEPERHCVRYSPAKYRVVQERFLVAPARCENVCDPAEFETRQRRVCVSPGRWEWRHNPACEVPCAPPEFKAIQTEMSDSRPDGEAEGIFAVGETVRYELVVTNDAGSSRLTGLMVVFSLPPELEFISGGGMAITGQGQSATSQTFSLEVGERKALFILCRVLSAPPSRLVTLTASVRDSSGELATETESTTLKPRAE